MGDVGKFIETQTLTLGLGSNMPGSWGNARQTLARACRELERLGVRIIGSSSYYSTEPVGDKPQPRYLNAVVLARTHIAPAALLRLLKKLEHEAGRRTAPAMSRRPLDLDIIDYGGRLIGWPSVRRVRGRLVLPHPEMHKRAFVLVPLLEVAPAWRHPVLGLAARALLARLPSSDRAGVRQALDSPANTCDKLAS